MPPRLWHKPVLASMQVSSLALQALEGQALHAEQHLIPQTHRLGCHRLICKGSLAVFDTSSSKARPSRPLRPWQTSPTCCSRCGTHTT